jgi:DUF4097 and DUF4098 domain-containing protein YvlB
VAVTVRIPRGVRLAVSSGNGAVNVTGATSEVEARSGNGEVTSDFPITTTGRFSSHRLSGRIGQGGASLRLHTGNGDIELRRLAARQ